MGIEQHQALESRRGQLLTHGHGQLDQQGRGKAEGAGEAAVLRGTPNALQGQPQNRQGWIEACQHRIQHPLGKQAIGA